MCVAHRRRVRRAGRSSPQPGHAAATGGGPGRRRRHPGGGLHGVLEPRHDRAPAARAVAARAWRRVRHRHVRHPVGPRHRRPRGGHRRQRREARPLRRPRCRGAHQLPRAGLRRGPAAAGRRDPRRRRGEVPRPQRPRAGRRRPAGGHRPAGRGEGRTQPRCAAVQARIGDRHLPAQPSHGAEGGDLRGRGARRVAALRDRGDPPDHRPGAPAGRRHRSTPSAGGLQPLRQGAAGRSNVPVRTARQWPSPRADRPAGASPPAAASCGGCSPAQPRCARGSPSSQR